MTFRFLCLHRFSKRNYLFLFVLSLFPSLVSGRSLGEEEAFYLYRAGEYSKAAQLYQEQADKAPSAALYYNIGNCFYAQNQLGKAILWYKRAQGLDPNDSEIAYNLNLARKKRLDHWPTSLSPMEALWIQFLNFYTPSSWGRISFIAFALLLICIAFYLTGVDKKIRKTSFYLSLLLFPIVLIGNIAMHGQIARLRKTDQIVVISTEAALRNAPNKQDPPFVTLHSGMELTTIGTTKRNFIAVRLPDHREGWIDQKDIEEIFPHEDKAGSDGK